MRTEGSQIRQSAPPLAHFEDENRVSKHQAGTYTNKQIAYILFVYKFCLLFFSDKPLLPKEYFQGFDIQTSELNDEHQGGENIGFQKSCKIIFLIFGELSQILI